MLGIIAGVITAFSAALGEFGKPLLIIDHAEFTRESAARAEEKKRTGPCPH